MSNASSFGFQFDGDEKSFAPSDFEFEYTSFKNAANPSALPNPRAKVVNDGRTRNFKTQLCRRFRQGICSLGSDCSFAHCVGELRRQEFGNDYRSFQESKLCKMFYQWQQCSYGNTCRFLHTRPASVNSRDTATEVIPIRNGKRKYDQLELKSGFDESSNAEVNLKRELLRTKKCIKWDMKGYCPYGDMCRFAHGESELVKLDGYSTAECRLERTSAAATNVSSDVVSTGTLLNKMKESFACNYKFNTNELHRISRIYADWI